jgi:uncharacterized integral membrane protein
VRPADQGTAPEALSSAAVGSATPPRSKVTRTSGAWAAIALGLTTFIVVLAFAVQNLASVDIAFFSLHLQLPLAILLLLAAVLGASIVFAFGSARIVQLRMQARRSRARPTQS